MSVVAGILDDTRVMDDESRMDLPRPIDKDLVRVGDTVRGHNGFDATAPDVELKVFRVLDYDFVSTGGLLVNRHAYEWTLLARDVPKRRTSSRWYARDFSRWIRTGRPGSHAYVCYMDGGDHEVGTFAAEYSRLAQELRAMTTLYDA